MSTTMVDWALAASLFAAGVIHLLPLSGVVSACQLGTLYGVALDDPTLILLLRHRALMFGLLGAAFLVAAFVPDWRVLAGLAALLSMLGFIALAGAGPHPAAILRVIRIDLVVSVALGATLAAKLVLIAIWRGSAQA